MAALACARLRRRCIVRGRKAAAWEAAKALRHVRLAKGAALSEAIALRGALSLPSLRCMMRRKVADAGGVVVCASRLGVEDGRDGVLHVQLRMQVASSSVRVGIPLVA